MYSLCLILLYMFKHVVSSDSYALCGNFEFTCKYLKEMEKQTESTLAKALVVKVECHVKQASTRTFICK